MPRTFVNARGRPVNEHGVELSEVLPSSSAEYRHFCTYELSLSKAMRWATTDEDFIRETRAMITKLEPLLDTIVDKGELENANAMLDELREDADEVENDDSPPPSEAFQQAMGAAASGFAYGRDIEANIEAVHQALVRIHEFMPMITERGERKQISGRMSSLLRQRMGLVATMSDEQRADWVSRGGLPEQSDYLAAAKLNAANVAKRKAAEEQRFSAE